MGTKLVLGLWSLLCVTSLVSSKAVISCKDKNTCKHLRIITTNSYGIYSDSTQDQRLAESIDLHGNLMESFSGNDVSSFSQLKYLNLSYNLLQGDLQGISNRVQEIDLTYNQLTFVNVPGGVKKFIAVRNKLSQVGFAGVHVEDLNLSMNQLNTIPEISRLSKLVSLDLSCNEISEVDFNTFAGLRSLTTLNLANNRIYQTSGKMVLRNLKNFDISNNILTIFDDSFDSVQNVENLSLQNNEIVMITTEQQFSSLKSIDFRNNDWDCKSLHAFLDKYNYLRQPQDSPNCKYGSIGKHKLCCLTTLSPYADRVIRYNKREFEALQNSSAIREHGVSCANYEPSPCDGDDNKVYEVANAAANDIQSLVSQDKQQLQGVLKQQQSLLAKKQEEKEQIDRENSELQTTLDNLTGYIWKLYTEEVPNGQNVKPAEQLKEIFAKRDADNKATLEQVNEEERKLQNLLTDIAKIEEDLQDLSDKKERLQGDINSRNATVIEHEKKIQELKVKLGKA